MKHFFYSVFVLGLVFCFGSAEGAECSVDNGNIACEDKVIKDDKNNIVGKFRYHYDKNVATCKSLIVVGVGTFMSSDNYDKLAGAISSDSPGVTVILDHNPGGFRKTSASEFSVAITELLEQLEDLIPVCSSGEDDPPLVFIGGHSASGQAALQAFQQGLLDSLPHLVSGFVGLDPYEISQKTLPMDEEIDLPGLFWGFTETTCKVDVSKAAQAAYGITTNQDRVLYLLDNDNSNVSITHCVFTDDGCGKRPLFCGMSAPREWIFASVAKSINSFVSAVTKSKPFTHGDFVADELPVGLKVFVDSEEVSAAGLDEESESEAAAPSSWFGRLVAWAQRLGL